MQDNSISARNIGCLIALMSMSSLLLVGFGTVGQDMWLAVIAATVFAIPLTLMYSRIAGINPGLNLFEMVDKHFGRIWGRIATVLLSWYALHVSALVTHNFSEFVVVISLEKTPTVFIIIGLIAVGGYLAGTNFQVMGRWSIIILVVSSINLLLTLLLSLSSLNFSHLKPVMEHSLSEILSVSFSFGSVAFADTILALVAFGAMKKEDKRYKAYGIGIGYGFVLMLCVVLRNAMLLGREMLETAIFPSYIASRIINPGTYIEHIESMISFNLILLGITKASICLRAASMGAARLLGSPEMYRKVLVPICLLSISICVTTFSNMQELLAFVEAYRYYSVPFAIVIPVILWLKSEADTRKAPSRS